MPAAALEQSVLESKDKDTLLEMAKALGVKANTRLKKADIIARILDTTGPTDDAPATGTNGSADAKPADSKPVDTNPVDTNPVDAKPDNTSSDASAAPADVSSAPDSSDDTAPTAADTAGGPDTNGASTAVGADGEPLADWEIALAEQGVDTTTTPADAPTERDAGDAKKSDRQDDRGDGKRQRNRNDRNDRDGDSRQRNDGQRNNNQQRNNNNNNQQRNDGEGGGNRRRRRRRKNRNNAEGPQGEDLEILDGDEQPQSNEPTEVSGYLDIRDEGYGFLRVNGYLPNKADAYIPLRLARQFGLRKGDQVTGLARPAQRNEKNPGLIEVHTVNGGDPEAAKKRPKFEDLTALFPDQKLALEDPSDPSNMTARIIDLVSPIGKGQRGLIVSPPKAGKTTIMKTIAKSIELNNPETELIVLLIDERPEEVTDMKRTVTGEVIASTFDRPSDEHTAVAEMAIAKAKRRVEAGVDVVIMLDGITRLSRAYNLAAPASGRILSGGIDAGALYPPKKFFGAARNVEEGGSLTILATALVDTNSRMDEAIFEEFKGTGNMELRLDRKVAERRIYPAIDVDASSTRHEELLFDRKQLQQVWKLRRVLSGLAADGNAAPGLELLIDRLKTFRTNDEFLAEIARQPSM
ncbi:MAG: transcription termination factor Rho [Actinomycetota bacterium]